MKRKVTRKPKSKRPPRSPVSRAAKAAKQGGKKAAKKAAAAAPQQPDAIDLMIRAGTHALRLPLEPAWYGGVKFNLQLIMRLAALVDEFPLPDAAEPAPVFHA